MNKNFHRAGFSLAEIVIAIGVVVAVLIPLLALLATGLNSVRETSQEGGATNILTAVAADVRNVPRGETDSTLYEIPVWAAEGGLPLNGFIYLDEYGRILDSRNDDPAGQPDADARYVVAWTIPEPQSPAGSRVVHIRIGWPGNAPNPTGRVETLVVLARDRR